MVSGSLSSDDGGQGSSSAPQSSYSEVFDSLFPQYLFMGMSAAEYWDGDNSLPSAYRKVHQLREEERNTDLWLQGLYVYEAILRASPVLHAFAKKGTKAMPYLQEPYPLTKEKAEEMAERRKQENYAAMKAKMKAQTERINRQRKEGEQKHGNDNRPITN